MYICLDCDREFETPDTAAGEQLEHFGVPCRDAYAACPFCGNADIATALICEQCGHAFLDLNGGLCDDCETELKKDIDRFVSSLTEAQKAYIGDEWDGVIAI